MKLLDNTQNNNNNLSSLRQEQDYSSSQFNRCSCYKYKKDRFREFFSGGDLR